MARRFARYTPTNIPADDNLNKIVYDNLVQIANVLTVVRDGHLDVVNVEPDKPAQGDIRYADGTDWNPGSGEGIYYYDSSGAWVKL